MVKKFQNIQLTPSTPSEIIVGFLSDLIFKRGDFESRRVHIPYNWFETSKKLPYPETFKSSPLYSELIKIGFITDTLTITEIFEHCSRKCDNVSDMIGIFYEQLNQNSITFLEILRDMIEDHMLVDDGFSSFNSGDYQVISNINDMTLELIPEESLSFMEDQELYRRWTDIAFQLHTTVIIHPHVGRAEMKFPELLGVPLHIHLKVMNRTFQFD